MKRLLPYLLSGLGIAWMGISAGCGSGVVTPPPAITVTLSSTNATVQAGGNLQFTASVQNDPANKGVTWTLSPAAGAGTLSNMTNTSVTYNSPANPPAADLQVTLTAASVANASKSSLSTITVPAITLSLSPTTVSVPVNTAQPVTATVQNDPGSLGVTWTLTQGGTSCSPGCGTVAPASTASGVAANYTAPAGAPANPVVTMTATSVADTTKFASATLTVTGPPQIVVTITPPSATVLAKTTLLLTATLQNDSANKGVTWSISPATGVGTLSGATSTSVTYNAPASPPSADLSVTITATSVADHTQSSTAAITVPAITVSLAAAPPSVKAGGTVAITAVVNNDSSTSGVSVASWTISPATGAGTLSNLTPSSATYNAPAAVPASDFTVSITATSVADPTKSGTVTITVLAISVSLTAPATSVQAGSTEVITAVVNNDPSNKGVIAASWTISPATGAGTLSSQTTSSVTYTAPATPPPSNLAVTITATSVADPTKLGSIVITVLAITVSGVTPATALIPLNATQAYSAIVQNDPANAGANWTLTQGGTSCSPSCGAVAPANTASGAPTTYTAPATMPASPAVTITATSASDATKSASVTITLSLGTVKLVPISLSFGGLKVGSSKTLSTTLTNTGSTALTITGFAFSNGPFTQTNTCGTSVAAGASCVIAVRFAPTVVLTFSATLSVNDSSVDTPQLVHLSGSGLRRRFAANALSTLSSVRSAVVPSPTGPSKVGTRVMDLVDSTREDPYLANGMKRELMVRFWYPASVSEGCQPADYTSPEVWKHFAQLVGIPLPEVQTNSCLDAPVAKGAHPILVFTHGYTGTFTDYTFIFEDLASRGYVVASVDHTYEATAVEFSDGRMAESVLGSYIGGTSRSDDQAFKLAVTARLSDLKFVVDELERLNTAPKGPFLGKLDTSRVALAGHSLGGLTAMLGAQLEPRFKAAILIDGVVEDRLAIPTTTPVLILNAGHGEWSIEECHLWSALRGPRLAVNLKGADHLTPSDAVWLAKGAIQTGDMGLEKTIAAIRNYIAAFLDANLQDKRTGTSLTGMSAEFPDAELTAQKPLACGEN